MKNKRSNKALWSLIFLVIAAVTVWAVASQNRNFSFSEFAAFVADSNPVFIVCAVLCMLGFIFFEGLALIIICRSFGYKKSIGKGIMYSATDIYFSAITPSATGGQPACCYYMANDGIPSALAAVALVANLVAYTASIIVIIALCLIFMPSMLLNFGTLGQVLIIVGVVVQIGLLFGFMLLLRNEKPLKAFFGFCLKILKKLRLVKGGGRLERRLDSLFSKYAEYSAVLSGKSKMLTQVFICNFLQRICLIAVTSFSFLAIGGKASGAFSLFFLQSYVLIGSNYIPIPGAMGVTDYLMLDGFSSVMTESTAVNLELLSRSVSFYSCVILCGALMLISYFFIMLKERKGCEK